MELALQDGMGDSDELLVRRVRAGDTPAFARAFKARDRLDPERPFYAWLYQIIRRLCFNYTRDRRTRRRAAQTTRRRRWSDAKHASA